MRDRIKIALVVDVIADTKGGAERQIYEIAKHVDRAVFELFLFVIHQSFVPVEFEKLGIFCKGLGIKRIYDLHGFVSGIRFAGFLRKNKISILMTYHFASDVWGTIFGKWAGVRTIFSNRRDVGFWRNKRHIFFYRCVNPWVSLIIVVSDAVKQMVVRDEGARPEKVRTIYNGVDLDRFGHIHADTSSVFRNDLGVKAGEVVITAVGNLTPVKCWDVFLKAAAEVVKKSDKVRFFIVGDGPLRQELLGLSQRLSLEGHVAFLGKRQDVPEILAASDVCVLASRSEGFSNAVLEYMAAGRPCVVTRVGGNPEIVTDGVNGFLAPPFDPTSLAVAILKLVSDEGLRREVGERARKRIVESFEITRMAATYQKIFFYWNNAAQSKKSAIRAFSKECLAQIFFRTGLFLLWRRLSRRNTSVLCYHRIVPDFSEELHYSKFGMMTSCATFEKQMMFLKKFYSPISLKECISRWGGGENYPDNAVLVTFDDGYRDNYGEALSILKRYQVPASIFLSTDFIDQKVSPAWDFFQLKKDRLMLNWEEVRKMVREGVMFGAHTSSHLLMSDGESRQVFLDELKRSRDIITAHIGEPVLTFAYPGGLFVDIDDDRYLELGYRIGFCLDRSKRHDSPFYIPRTSVCEGMGMGWDGKFSDAMFALGLFLGSRH